MLEDLDESGRGAGLARLSGDPRDAVNNHEFIGH